MDDTTCLSGALEHWRTYNHQRENTDPELAALGILRDWFPKYHITLTKTSKCDLIGFATAGHATAVLSDDQFSYASRSYEAPAYRLDKASGRVKDEVGFGRWSYNWNNTDYFVYQVDYKDRYERLLRSLFVLHPDGPKKLYNAATDALLLAAGQWTKELHGEIYVFDTAEWKKSKELFKSVEGSSWEDVILDADMKASLIDDVQNFFDAQELYHAMNVPWKRGVILHGLPGNGKTLSIKALINNLSKRENPVPALYVKSLDACSGPKWSIQVIFKKARIMAPCLLIFEDLDSMVSQKTRSYFLNEVDGLESNEGILMIGSTNHLDQLDTAITKRPSRFDRKYNFRLPDEERRADYCRYWCQKFVESKSVDFPESICPVIAKMTEGFSFAYLKELFITSLLTLARGTPDEDIEKESVHGAFQSDNTSAAGSDAVVVESEDTPKDTETAEAAEAAKAAAAAATALEAQKASKLRRLVEIPKEFDDIVLLRIVKKNVIMLLGEMDNTDKASEKIPACDNGPPVFSPEWFAQQTAREEED